jgi:hypothetical protein
MSVQELLEERSIDYWDFSNSKLSGIHKISTYPATMVPDMQKELIQAVMDDDPSINSMLDPFHGSGVTLVEGAALGLDPIGFDINPLANLMTLVKLQGVNKNDIKQHNNKIMKLLNDTSIEFPIHSFNNIEKWFREDVIFDLSKIRYAIKQEKYKYYRQYYWVCLTNIIKKYSNTRSSTFKLHVKEQIDIQSLRNNIMDDFFRQIQTAYYFLPDYDMHKKIDLLIGDTKEILSKMSKNSVDLICTSPPYGDNATTVTYGQYSILSLYWIDRKDLGNFDDTLLENYSSIDSSSLGGIKKARSENTFESEILSHYLDLIAPKKQRKVVKFITDYIAVFDYLADVLRENKYMILTLGNRRVDNKVMPLTEITKEFLAFKGFTLETEISRNIPVKRMPKKVSSVNNESVSSMNSEFVLIFKKESKRGKE